MGRKHQKLKPSQNSSVQESFNKYKNSLSKRNVMKLSGITALCTDLGIEVTDPVILVFCMHCEAKKMGELSFEEFTRGMNKLGCHNETDLKSKMGSMKQDLRNKPVYRFAFAFLLDKEEKSLPLEVCVEYW
eukprot:Selendium_serpulae@DN1642_c0_g1_i2.p1